jgi:FtsP/CotA-like multicopper oxidase with cupredoxin domain
MFGRTQSVPLSGIMFRPQFYYEGKDWDCIIFSDTIELLNVGESASVFVAFSTPEYHAIHLHEGQVSYYELAKE